jgi:phosphoserine/homoserine phosphotransferase
MYIVCSDLEGVFVPEIWISVAEKTGIEALKLTTRDEPDYDVLMRRRIAILRENNLKLADITRVISDMDPLEGALEFLDWLRSIVQVIVLSDTFVEFAGPLMQKLNWPTLFCNSLKVNSDGAISGYVLRQPDGKRQAIAALKNLNYKVIAMGDSYNDITMIQTADRGILFRSPKNIRAEYPGLPVAEGYEDLKKLLQLLLVK